jgi:hypothetical protein
MPSSLEVPLPCDEAVFLQMSHSLTPSLKQPLPTHDPVKSILAQMIKLNRILQNINLINKRAVSEQLESFVLNEMVLAAAQQLDDWQAVLPDTMRDTPENQMAYAAAGKGRLFT